MAGIFPATSPVPAKYAGCRSRSQHSAAIETVGEVWRLTIASRLQEPRITMDLVHPRIGMAACNAARLIEK